MQLLFQQIAGNSIGINAFFQACAIAGRINAWRIVFRQNAVDVAGGNWGTPNWGQAGPVTTEEGTTNETEVLRMLISNRVPNRQYEVQISVNGLWYSAASLLQLAPAIPNTVPGIAELYMPGPPIDIYSFTVPAETASFAPPPAPFNASNPVGAPIAGFTNGYHNVGGPGWATNGMKDPTGQYILQNPSPMFNDWSKMVWVKQ